MTESIKSPQFKHNGAHAPMFFIKRRTGKRGRTQRNWRQLHTMVDLGGYCGALCQHQMGRDNRGDDKSVTSPLAVDEGRAGGRGMECGERGLFGSSNIVEVGKKKRGHTIQGRRPGRVLFLHEEIPSTSCTMRKKKAGNRGIQGGVSRPGITSNLLTSGEAEKKERGEKGKKRIGEIQADLRAPVRVRGGNEWGTSEQYHKKNWKVGTKVGVL